MKRRYHWRVNHILGPFSAACEFRQIIIHRDLVFHICRSNSYVLISYVANHEVLFASCARSERDHDMTLLSKCVCNHLCQTWCNVLIELSYIRYPQCLFSAQYFLRTPTLLKKHRRQKSLWKWHHKLSNVCWSSQVRLKTSTIIELKISIDLVHHFVGLGDGSGTGAATAWVTTQSNLNDGSIDMLGIDDISRRTDIVLPLLQEGKTL